MPSVMQAFHKLKFSTFCLALLRPLSLQTEHPIAQPSLCAYTVLAIVLLSYLSTYIYFLAITMLQTVVSLVTLGTQSITSFKTDACVQYLLTHTWSGSSLLNLQLKVTIEVLLQGDLEEKNH